MHLNPTNGHARTLAVAGLSLCITAATLAVSSGTASAVDPAPRTYYLSATGHDTANGLSTGTAWRTIQRANSQSFQAGDRLLLEGGSRFAGMLYFDARDLGTAAAPVQVGSFGVGKATITAAGAPAIYAYNTAGLTISDLALVGDAASYASKGGVSFYSDLPAGQRLSGVHLTGLDVQGFRNGIEIGGRNAGAGFANVAVTSSALHDNRETGLLTYGPAFNAAAPTYANGGVHVSSVSAFRNLGDPNNLVRNTGSGIVLGSVAGGSVTSSQAYANGSRCRAVEGPAGIWTYDSRGIRIAYNQSYSNRTGGPADGDGFDLDQNVGGSVMEYNKSWNNDGAGYLVFTAQANWAHKDNIVRYNTSSDDSRKSSWYGGVTVVGRILRTSVYGNVVTTATSPVLSPALAVGSQVQSLSVTGNTLTAATGTSVVAAPALTRTAAAFTSNRWTVASQQIRWGSTYRSVPVWGAATGQS